MSRHGLITILAAAAVLGMNPAFACDNCKSSYQPGTYRGPAKAVGNGIAFSWVELNEKGKPASLGVTLTETALSNLPENKPASMPHIEFSLDLPKQAGKTAFTHIGLNWNPKGHTPKGIYDVPHFDFHFYLLTQKERMGITARGSDLAICQKPLPARYIAPGYIFAPQSEEPEMGAHWVDPTSPELQGKPFTHTFIYGSYNGKLAFFEPMIAKSFLESRSDVTQELKTPAAYQTSGYYPTRYAVRYDKARHEYTIALENLVWKDAKANSELAAR